MDAAEQVQYVKERIEQARNSAECARFAMERLAAYIGRNRTIDAMIYEVQAHQRRVQELVAGMDRVLHNRPDVSIAATNPPRPKGAQS